ncbi:FtsB family cell division protein [Thiovibrio frasassiensis]|jgi:cell division protein FtsB|uniref:Septum formation initiator family protein n=1 Tax=Thiovibrio frasassiensis TaxID=2984131 RepID=A0A9X4ML80_9BACT|nr:septum formation initiator family protein [Thiovibrio frasassiensis]MDG4476869.1 septum formation initiator family protein [Thiovibrio frasassiensis]
MLANLSENDRKKVLLYSVLIVTVVGAWSVFGPYGALKYYGVANELEEVLAQNDQLRENNTALRQEITKLKKDPVYLEEVARREFGLIKKNEVIYEFPEKKKRH